MKNNNIEDKFYNGLPLSLDFRDLVIQSLRNAQKKQNDLEYFVKRVGVLKEQAKGLQNDDESKAMELLQSAINDLKYQLKGWG